MSATLVHQAALSVKFTNKQTNGCISGLQMDGLVSSLLTV